MTQPRVYQHGDRVHVTTAGATGDGYVGYRAGTPSGTYTVQLDDTRHVQAAPDQMRLVRKAAVR